MPARNNAWIIILILLPLSLLWNLGLAPAYLEEPRRAMIAMEMIFSGNWIVPTQLGEFYYNKTPLFNWFIAVGFLISSNFDILIPRIISVLSLLGSAYLLYRFLKNELGTTIAFYSAIFYIISADIFFYFSTTGEIDLFYSFISLASILSIYHFDKKENKLALYSVPALLAAAGFLTKGFPSPLFVGFTFLAWFSWQKEWKKIFSPWISVSVLCFFAPVLLYFFTYSQYAEVSPYLEALFGQSSQRTASEFGIGDFILHLLVFPLENLVKIAPATLALPLLFDKAVRKKLAANPMLRFVLIALAANIWVYWISPGTRSRYLYMLYPLAISVLSWAWMQSLESAALNRYRTLLNSSIIVAAIVGSLVAIFWVFNRGIETSHSWPLAFGLLTAGLILFYLFRKQDYGLSSLALLFICGRLIFDVAVLPQRAIQGQAPEWKERGMQIAADTQGTDLFLYGSKNAGNFSLAAGYYIEKERGETLNCHRELRSTAFYLVEDRDLKQIPGAEKIRGYNIQGRNFTLIWNETENGKLD
jgi:4-amino-4-deoxy-L-arabinose transferase-like glycosyltransferase